MDVRTLRQELARQFDAEVTCPTTTGFHLRTVAEAVCEALDAGRDIGAATPLRRVLDAKAPTTKKLSCGAALVTKQREGEGLSP